MEFCLIPSDDTVVVVVVVLNWLPSVRHRCRFFQSTVGHARWPLPQLALSVSPNNVSSLLRMCHPPNHHIGLHKKRCVLGSKVKAVTVTAFTVANVEEQTNVVRMQLINQADISDWRLKWRAYSMKSWTTGVCECFYPSHISGKNWWKIPRHPLMTYIKVQKMNSTEQGIFKLKMFPTPLQIPHQIFSSLMLFSY